MKPGSLVETVGNFEHARLVWGFPYPRKGEPLTISAITHHPNPDITKKGIVLLHFEEIPNLPGLCDKNIHGQHNFIELKLPDEVEEILKAPMEITTLLKLQYG